MEVVGGAEELALHKAVVGGLVPVDQPRTRGGLPVDVVHPGDRHAREQQPSVLVGSTELRPDVDWLLGEGDMQCAFCPAGGACGCRSPADLERRPW